MLAQLSPTEPPSTGASPDGNRSQDASRSPPLSSLSAAPALVAQTYPTGTDPRNGLKPGRLDAGDRAERDAPRVVLAEAGRVRLDRGPDVHQLRPGVRRPLRLPGQLRRLHDLGREQSGEAGARRRRFRASRRRAIRRSSATCSSSPPRAAAIATTARRAACRIPKDHMAGVRIFDVSNPTRAEARQERADVQRLAHAHGHPEPDGQGHHLHLRVGQPGRAAGDGARGLQERHGSGGRDELALSGSTSSRCRSRIRRRPRS